MKHEYCQQNCDEPKTWAFRQSCVVEVMFADAEGLPEGRMKHVQVDQDPATIFLELFVPRSNLVLPNSFQFYSFVNLNILFGIWKLWFHLLFYVDFRQKSIVTYNITLFYFATLLLLRSVLVCIFMI